MDTTVKVRIVADTAQANTSLKLLSKETGQISGGATNANVSFDKLATSMKRLGTINLASGLTNAMSGLKQNTQSIASKTQNIMSDFTALQQKFDGLFDETSFSENINAFSGEIRNFVDNIRSSLEGLKDQTSIEALEEYLTVSEKAAAEIGENNQKEIDSYKKKASEISKAIQNIKDALEQQIKDAEYAEQKQQELSNAPTFRLSQIPVVGRYLRYFDETFAQAKVVAKQFFETIDITGKTAFEALGQAFKATFYDSSKDAGKLLKNVFQKIKEPFKVVSKTFKDTFSRMWATFKQTKVGEKLLSTFEGIGTKIKENVIPAFKSLFQNIKNLGSTLAKSGLVALALALAAMVKSAFSVATLGDQIDKSSRKIGMTTKAYQEWGYVLERCGIEATTLQTAVKQLIKKTASNKDVFSALGITTEGKSTSELFEETVKALQNIKNSTERAQQAYKVFGNAAVELAPLFGTTAKEVERLRYQYDLLGATMDGKTVKAAVDMKDSMTDLKSAFQGLKNVLAQALIPYITQFLVRLTVAIAKLNMILKVIFDVDGEFVEMAESAGDIGDGLESATKEAKKLLTLIAGFDELNIFPSQDNGEGGGIGGLADGLEDYYEAAGAITPYTGNILPESAIKELEDFKNNLDQIEQKWEHLKGVFKGTEQSEGFGEWLLKILGDQVKNYGIDYWMPEGKMDWEKFFSFEGMFGGEEDYKDAWTGKFLVYIAEVAAPATDKLIQFGSALKKIKDQKGLESGKLLKFLDALNQIKESKAEGNILGLYNALRKLPGAIKEILNSSEAFQKLKKKIGELQSEIDKLLEKKGIKTKIEEIKANLKDSDLFKKAEEVGKTVGGAFDKVVHNWRMAFDKSYREAQEALEEGNETLKPLLEENVHKDYQTVQEQMNTEGSLLWNLINGNTKKNAINLFDPSTWKGYAKGAGKGIEGAGIGDSLITVLNDTKRQAEKNSIFSASFWKEKFSAISKGFGSVSLSGAADGVVNGLAQSFTVKINQMLEGINNSSLVSKLKEWGTTILLPKLHIPGFAAGGVIDAPTLGIMGEYAGANTNPEIITPENKLTEIFENSNSDIVNVLVQGFRQIIETVENKDTTVAIGDTAIAKAAARGNNQYRLQTGSSLF